MKTNFKYTMTIAVIASLLALPSIATAQSEKSFPSKDVSSVRVQTIDAVAITAWTQSTVKIVCQSGNINSERVEVDKKAGSIHIDDMTSECEKIIISMPKNLKLKVSSISGGVSVKGLTAGAKITSVNGNVLVEDMEGLLSINVVDGKTTVNRVKGDVSCKSVSGKIEINNFAAPHLTAKSVSGSINVQSVTAETVTLKSHSGKIVFEKSALPKTELLAKTFSGKVKISIPNATGFDMSAKTLSGDINVEYPIQASTISDQKITGQYKHGGPDLTLGSFSGNISVTK